MKKIAFAVLAGLTICLLPSSLKAAQISYQGLSLSPAIEQLTIKPGQDGLSYKIRINSNLSQPVSIKISTLDFKSLNETGGLAFISNNASDIEHKYGLAQWVEVPGGIINLPAHGEQAVDIKIDNRPDLNPGGHYAAILFNLVAPGSANNNHVEVDQVISSLLFVRKSGGEIYGLSLKKITAHRSFAWLGWPTTLDTIFSNTGNVQTAPRGVITLSGTNTVLNPDSSLVLPGSTRLISTDLGSIKSPFWPGRYHIKLKYRPDGSPEFKKADVSFIYIGWRFLIALLILTFAAIFGLPRGGRVGVWRLIKRWLRKILKTASWLLKNILKRLWVFLIFIDTQAGKAMQKRDKRRSRKNSKR